MNCLSCGFTLSSRQRIVLQREIARQVNSIGTGTKSQQALQLQREQNKLIRQEKTKEQKEAEKRAAFALRQEKKKEKRRGH